MKMTPPPWRVLSVWLSVAVVSWYLGCHVGCAESHQEAQRPVSSQDVGSDNELGEKTPNHKVEESLVLPAQPPENELLFADNHQNDHQATQDTDKNEQYSEGSSGEVEVEADKAISQSEPETELRSENQNYESSVIQERDSVAQLQPSGFPDEMKDNPSILNLEDITPNGILDDGSYVAALEVVESDLPPSDCEEEGEEEEEEEEEDNNPYDNVSSPPLVLENTSNAHTAGTKTLTNSPLTSSLGKSAQHLDTNASHMVEEQDLSSPVTRDTDSTASTKDPEDIPTFDEWKRKMMEVENEKTLTTHTSHNGGSHTLKKAQKNFNNYASVECGAKILGANPEAKSTSAILMENMDLYMLNPCSNKVWFIIELCEPIQVKQLDIANFELFSSTPKDFLVSISDRYPTNKWLKLGTFHARDERTVQSFPLDEHLYAKYVKMFTKYIKVELVSHFGAEHFCPLSLIRVFGTSMVEEYEEISDPAERPDDQDDELDYPTGSGEVKLSKNLIGSAKDVIFNMVNNIAVNVLGGGPDSQVNISSHEVNMTEPSPQLATTTQTAPTDLTSVLDSEEEDTLPDPDTLETAVPSPESPVSEAPGTDTGKQEHALVEENIVSPLEGDEEEHIGTTITLLDKEEDIDEEKERMGPLEQQKDNQKDCYLLPSFSSSCSCTASLQEYLIRQCSALLSKKRKCQTADGKQTIPPITSTWHLALSPSACPNPRLHHSDVHQPHGKEEAAEQEPESASSSSEAPQPPGSTIETHKESVVKQPALDPSQTSSLPTPSAMESYATEPTPVVETPQPPREETTKESSPETSLDVITAERHTETSVSLSSSVYVKPGVGTSVDDASVQPTQANPDVSHLELTPVQIPDKMDQSQVLLPPTSPHVEHHPDPPAVPKSSTAPAELPHPAPDVVTELEPSGVPPVTGETKSEDFAEDIPTSSGGNGQLPRPSALAPSPNPPSLSDIYAEAPNGTEQNGNLVHGSGQKESVFMRLNNRIKALEMNMSLSGRYLEQLSQRYRKQMEEMQKAFNKTIIKLQNTSRIAEEQDLRQTESIQSLQGQLQNVTQLVLDLSVRVSQLQNEVSDSQNYLLLSLGLCVCLGLLLCINHRRISTSPPATEPEPPTPKSYTYCCPDSVFVDEHHTAKTAQFSSCDETGLKRRASYPLIHSESFQLATTEGPEMLHSEETQGICPANRKRRRRRMKLLDKVETLTPSFLAAPELIIGAVVCNGVATNTTPKRLLQPAFKDSLSEGSSEGSSHSDDPSFCGITTACSRICDGLHPPKSRAEKRALRRRCPKPSCAVVDRLQVPKKDMVTISTIQDKNTDQLWNI